MCGGHRKKSEVTARLTLISFFLFFKKKKCFPRFFAYAFALLEILFLFFLENLKENKRSTEKALFFSNDLFIFFFTFFFSLP